MAEFIVKLKSPADPTDQDAIRRLRNTLKGILRRYGWRCVEAVRAAEASSAGASSDGEARRHENDREKQGESKSAARNPAQRGGKNDG
jgi:hypothetical protein